MATKLELAAAKWARKTDGKGDKWAKSVKGQKTAYKKGVASFLETTEGAIGDVADDWETEVEDSDAQEKWEKGVKGKGDTWATNYKKKMLL